MYDTDGVGGTIDSFIKLAGVTDSGTITATSFVDLTA